jgi:adenine-specific DNA methylase
MTWSANGPRCGDWVFRVGNWKLEIGKSGDERRRSGSQKPHPLRAEGAAPGEGVKDDGGVPALPKRKANRSLRSG